ncbi:hypothetical protein ACPDIX_06795 [Limisphaera sp. 4302-co]
MRRSGKPTPRPRLGLGGAPTAGLFRAANVRSRNGMMQVTVGRLEQPVVRNGRLSTHQGAIVRSLHPGRPGWHFECRTRADAIVMSSTLWLMTPPGSARRLELDIRECVGRTTEQTARWARHWDRIFHSNLID